MLNRTLVAALTLGIGLAPVPTALAASQPQRVDIDLTVGSQAAPVCHGKVCTIANRGSGTMAGFGKVTFTTVITDDGSASPCPEGSYVPRLRRTIVTTQGRLVLNEAGLLCPEPGVGPRVDLVWVADGASSTGVFAGAHGSGIDHAYLSHKTAVQTGMLTLTR